TIKLTDDEGRFRLVTIPGPGVLLAKAESIELLAGQKINPFRHANISDQDAAHVAVDETFDQPRFMTADNARIYLATENVARYVDSDPDSKTVTVHLEMDRGRNVELGLQD